MNSGHLHTKVSGFKWVQLTGGTHTWIHATIALERLAQFIQVGIPISLFVSYTEQNKVCSHIRSTHGASLRPWDFRECEEDSMQNFYFQTIFYGGFTTWKRHLEMSAS